MAHETSLGAQLREASAADESMDSLINYLHNAVYEAIQTRNSHQKGSNRRYIRKQPDPETGKSNSYVKVAIGEPFTAIFTPTQIRTCVDLFTKKEGLVAETWADGDTPITCIFKPSS